MISQSQFDRSASLIKIDRILQPGQHGQLSHWDLTGRRPIPRYIMNAFTAGKLGSSPFAPELSRIRLILNNDLGWAFDINARPSERIFTLQRVIDAINTLMQTQYVPYAYWTRASVGEQEKILHAMHIRSKRPLPRTDPHKLLKTRSEFMEEAVLEDAKPGYTNLLVVDLLCDQFMFSGLNFVKEPNEFLLKAASRKK